MKLKAPASSGFRFLTPSSLLDRELQLVVPEARWVDELLLACQHPLTRMHDPEWHNTDREDLLRLIRRAPGGHEAPEPEKGRVATYHFWMRLHPVGNVPPPITMAGVLSFRVGSSPDIERYCGHLGYTVFPAARGRHYAERACRLLFPLARAHGIDPLWITTDPANTASRRTCERLGGVLVETIPIPQEHPLHARGQRLKCRYRVPLQTSGNP